MKDLFVNAGFPQKQKVGNTQQELHSRIYEMNAADVNP